MDIFLQDIAVHPPEIIIDASSSDRNTPPLSTSMHKEWKPDVAEYKITPEFKQITSFVRKHYKTKGTINNKWIIYKRI